MGASLLVFKNKSDVAGSMNEDDIREVRKPISPPRNDHQLNPSGTAVGQHSDAQVAHLAMLSDDGTQPTGRAAMGCARRKGSIVPLLIDLIMNAAV